MTLFATIRSRYSLFGVEITSSSHLIHKTKGETITTAWDLWGLLVELLLTIPNFARSLTDDGVALKFPLWSH